MSILETIKENYDAHRVAAPGILPNLVMVNKKDYAELRKELAEANGTKSLAIGDNHDLMISTMRVIKTTNSGIIIGYTCGKE